MMNVNDSNKLADLTKEMVEDLTKLSAEEYLKRRQIARVKFPSKVFLSEVTIPKKFPRPPSNLLLANDL